MKPDSAGMREIEQIIADMTPDERLYITDQTSYMYDILTPLGGITALGLAFPTYSDFGIWHHQSTPIGIAVRAHLLANPHLCPAPDYNYKGPTP